MKKRYLSIIFSFFISFAFSQNSNNVIDSLKTLIKSSKRHALVENLNLLSWEYKNIEIDSALFFARKSLKVATKLEDDKARASAFNSLANCFDAIGQLDSALIYNKRGLDINLEVGHKVGAANSYNNIGIVYDLMGDFDRSLQNYFEALKIYESETVSFHKIPMVLSNIGIVYKKQKEYDKVLDYYNRALKIYEANNYRFGIVVTKGNIGSVLINLKEFEKSIKFCSEAKVLYQELGYKRYVPYMISNLAYAKDSLKLYKQSQKDFREAIDLFIKDKNLYELVHVKLGLSHSLLKERKSSAYSHGLEALNIAKKEGFKEWEVKALKLLADIEKLRGNSVAYSNYIETYISKKDSLFEENKTKTIFELETKYQTEKKQKEILSQRAEIAEKELNINQKNTQIIGLAVLAIVLVILGYLLYNQQKLKNRQLQKENELKRALVEIETHNKLQEQRLRISRDLHDNIGAQLTFIISSIENLEYGFKITNDKLKSKLTNISTFTKETIYELRDTIWAMNKNEITLEDLQSRISNFIDKAGTYSGGLQFSVNIDKKLPEELVFTSVKGMNIYRIIQEAVNNAIKHAGASNIRVDIKRQNEKVVFSIKDNGKGFDVNNIADGNGLNNMKKRAIDINTDIIFNSEEGKGTDVILSV